MKKIKSLLSLMLVMIFMLSLAGPMAFAAGEVAVTVTARDPYFDTANKKYVSNGYTVTRDSDGFDLKDILPAELVSVAVNAEGATVTATPSVSNTFVGSDNVTYKVSKTVPASISKPSVSVTAKAPVIDSNGEFVHGWLTGTFSSVPVFGECEVYDAQFNVVDSGSTVTSTPSAAKIKLKSNGADVTNAFVVTNYTPGVYNKATVIITANDPVNQGGQFIPTGVTTNPNPITLVVNGTEEVCTPSYSYDVQNNNSNVTAALKDVKIISSNTGLDVTKAFIVVTEEGSIDKETINIIPNEPKLENGQYKSNGFTHDAASNVIVSVNSWIISNTNGVVSIQADEVVISSAADGADLTQYYHVNKEIRTTSGTITNPSNPTPSPSVPPVTTKTKLVIQAVDAEKAYNGYSFSSSQARGVKYANNTSLLSGHSLNASVLKIQYTRRSDGVMFNDYTDVYKVGTYDKKLIVPTTNVVLDAAGNDVTSQYDISTIDGILTIYNSGWVSPDTGDNSNMVLWIVLLAVSAVAVAAVVIVVLKKNKKA